MRGVPVRFQSITFSSQDRASDVSSGTGRRVDDRGYMANEDILKKLDERLSRLEAALAGGTGGSGNIGTPPGGFVVDPAPDPYPWPYPYPFPHWPWPHPIVDKATHWPRTVVDQAPTAIVPDPWRASFLTATNLAARIGKVGDPPPPDFSRLNISQLESTLHSIAAEKARLDGLEKLVKGQMDRLKQQG